ncbi:MAG: glycosyltransferase family 4 protein [Blastocatellia bacterium]|nr:glycosyltransferase family 4 protein [Blastocatellia bacterium]
MKLTFILPMYLDVPSGGFKVVYEYANRLQGRGHRVTLIHPRTIERAPGVVDALKRVVWPHKIRWRNRPLVPWFPLRPEVEVRLVPDLGAASVPRGDAIIATAYETAFPVAGYPADRGRKFHLIQSYETWSGPEERVRASWRLPMRKIVVSRALLATAAELGVERDTMHIPIALDAAQFYVATPIEKRPAPRVSMVAHPNESKGMRDGLAALDMARAEVPELEAALFGTQPRDASIPAWMEYLQLPAAERIRALHNSCRVFLHPSWSEGWGLPAAEAMACGCALVSADNGGVHEFAADEESALIAPIKSPSELARRIVRLLRDDDLRVRIARAGAERARAFSWERAVERMEEALCLQ